VIRGLLNGFVGFFKGNYDGSGGVAPGFGAGGAGIEGYTPPDEDDGQAGGGKGDGSDGGSGNQGTGDGGTGLPDGGKSRFWWLEDDGNGGNGTGGTGEPMSESLVPGRENPEPPASGFSGQLAAEAGRFEKETMAIIRAVSNLT
jgi:hypothetical protein